ncbi:MULTISPECIES: 2,3-diphosphoglycerate-dependent phosphoglycerate mutase [unclassified Thermoplasma]|uniref:2,3-diphosphoglycerate-dependent phosphoglycerate mutase n=1 Tax=unclassified Thermoplasma TaxID=2684908 RepID=UPI000DA03DA6|nr:MULTISPECIES: 2,3-diphosphoglycerate-dependent phosphoglycerate mutase [unclassified Thermoplasma]PYB68337.1 histidine phosphatase family protein [Thermoplasma sp. Kam2015]
MEKAILVRHGESETNVYGIISTDEDRYPLTENGVFQVQRTAAQLAELDFDGIISSPILRAYQSAQIIASATGLSIVKDERARESEFGPYNNSRITEIPYGTREELEMEPWESHVRRMRSLVSDYDGSYIIVSHAYPIKSLLCDFLGLGEFDCFSVEIKNASMSAVLVKEERVLTIGSLILSESVKNHFRK